MLSRRLSRLRRRGGTAVDPRLASIAARAPIPVETAAGGAPFDDGGTYTWRDYKKLIWTGASTPHDDVTWQEPGGGARVDEAILAEVHHRQYGRPWALGRYVFDHVLARGLLPGHRLLDIGCGALRFGVHAIAHLEPGRYCGIDAHLKSLEAAATYEIPLHGLEAKAPRLLWDDRFRFGHFGGTFDRAVDFYTGAHVPETGTRELYERIAAALSPGGLLLCSPEPRLDVRELAGLGLVLVHHEVQRCPLLEGHGFDATNEWFEYRRA